MLNPMSGTYQMVLSHFNHYFIEVTRDEARNMTQKEQKAILRSPISSRVKDDTLT